MASKVPSNTVVVVVVEVVEVMVTDVVVCVVSVAEVVVPDVVVCVTVVTVVVLVCVVSVADVVVCDVVVCVVSVTEVAVPVVDVFVAVVVELDVVVVVLVELDVVEDEEVEVVVVGKAITAMVFWRSLGATNRSEQAKAAGSCKASSGEHASTTSSNAFNCASQSMASCAGTMRAFRPNFGTSLHSICPENVVVVDVVLVEVVEQPHRAGHVMCVNTPNSGSKQSK
jgi:hypothetical protein